MDMQKIHGVSSLGAKLRQEIRRQTQGYHERRHYYWRRQALSLWIVVGLLIMWMFW